MPLTRPIEEGGLVHIFAVQSEVPHGPIIAGGWQAELSKEWRGGVERRSIRALLVGVTPLIMETLIKVISN
jgi:hypothetical protein